MAHLTRTAYYDVTATEALPRQQESSGHYNCVYARVCRPRYRGQPPIVACHADAIRACPSRPRKGRPISLDPWRPTDRSKAVGTALPFLRRSPRAATLRACLISMRPRRLPSSRTVSLPVPDCYLSSSYLVIYKVASCLLASSLPPVPANPLPAAHPDRCVRLTAL